MSENTTPVVTQEADPSVDFDALMADWGGTENATADTEDEADQQDADDQQDDAGQQKDTEQAEGDADTEDDKADDKTDGKKDADPQTFTLKHLDEVKSVNKDEVVALAQKGLDYDRQRQKNDDLARTNTELSGKLKELEQYTDYAAFLKELAEPQKLTVEQLIDDTRAGILARTQGISKEVAAERIKNQRERAAEAAKQKEAAAKTPEQLFAERRDREIAEFLTEYKDNAPKTIPQEVWNAVNAGKSLLSAYQAHEKQQLQAEKDRLAAELEAERKTKENKTKSTGSRHTAGATKNTDPYTADWYSN